MKKKLKKNKIKKNHKPSYIEIKATRKLPSTFDQTGQDFLNKHTKHKQK